MWIFNTRAKYYQIKLNRWWVMSKRLQGLLFIGAHCTIPKTAKNNEPRYYFSSTSPISIISQYTLHSSARVVQITILNHQHTKRTHPIIICCHGNIFWNCTCRNNTNIHQALLATYHIWIIIWLAYRYSVCHCQCRPSLARSFLSISASKFYWRRNRLLPFGAADSARCMGFCAHSTCHSTMPAREL